MMEKTSDIRYEIFRGSLKKSVTAVLIAEAGGVLSGLKRASGSMESLGLSFSSEFYDGAPVNEGREIARIVGNPVQIAMAEEHIIGTLSKSSGIATVAFRAREKSPPHCRVVSGGWKKMPVEIKGLIRQAASDGGIDIRISNKPFIYLDKNYVRILGGIKKAIQAVLPLKKSVAIQVRGETDAIANEAVEAAETGAEVIMVDTGIQRDAEDVIRVLKEKDLRGRVLVAFAGNIVLEELGSIRQLGLDILDIGYAILDAPCLPMRFDVVDVAG
jgi:nicotinate-nucleotide pyrophosphorylase (carboxylating)